VRARLLLGGRIMLGRKWRLVLGWLLIDLAAIGLVVWQIGNISGRRGWGENAAMPPATGEMNMPRPVLENSGVQLAVGSAGPVSLPLSMFGNLSPSGFGITAMKNLSVGAPVKDFTLLRVREGLPVRLADLRAKKPVVLILSSFSCNVFCGQVDTLEKLYRRYRDRAEFILVVVSEAKHTIPGLEFLLHSPSNPELRRRLVARALDLKKVTIPAVLDTRDREVEKAYAAFPMRLVVVSPSGYLTLDARFRGDQGLDLVRVSKWLEHNLPQ